VINSYYIAFYEKPKGLGVTGYTSVQKGDVLKKMIWSQ